MFANGSWFARVWVNILSALGVCVLLIEACVIFFPPVSAVDLQTSAVITICGDGVVGSAEVCDLGAGNNLGTYGSSTAERVCAADCVSFGPYCGDDILQVRFGEECDDGNHTDGDLCSATCESETAVPPPSPSSPPGGVIPAIPGADPGAIPAGTTKVVVRGKAYPNADVRVLVDGKEFGVTRADSKADFMYTTTGVTPGITTFGFSAKDSLGADSLTTAFVFEVVQSAVTTIANVLIPPTISASAVEIPRGEFLTLQGQTAPDVKVHADVFAGGKTSFSAESDQAGLWALQIDTSSLTEGFNTAKALFDLSIEASSGYGKSVGFLVGEGSVTGTGSADVNGDAKVNLVDFSIFLISWGKVDARYDFNKDGTVNLGDFSIMLFNWTG